MNQTKTIARAIECGINPRKAMRHVRQLESTAKVRGDMAALLVSIHGEIAPQLAAMRKADELLDNCTKGRPATGVNETQAGSLAKYEHVYSVGTIPGSLARENSAFAGLMVASMEQAGENTRSLAGGVNAKG
jgi:hypothetical protein